MAVEVERSVKVDKAMCNTGRRLACADDVSPVVDCGRGTSIRGLAQEVL